METRSRILQIVSLAATVLAGCSSSSDTPPAGSGGAVGTGGASASGGSGSGGKMGTGGSSATGGSTSVGGKTGSGGSDGLGGHSGTGGVHATGGMAVAGGSTGAGGMTALGGAGSGGKTGNGGAMGMSGGTTAGGATGNGGATAAGGSSGSDGGIKDGGVDLGIDAGSTTFDPCPATGACKILPFGDSITFGLLAPDYSTDKEGGYRAEIFTKAVAANQNITFTGSQTSGPTTVAGKPFPQSNEGHSGWTIDPISGSPGGISTLVPSPAFTTMPHIVLLMIGTNDSSKISAQTMADDLAKLIDNIISTAPNALLAVAKLPPLSAAQSTIDAYNKLIPGLVQTRSAAGKHIIVVDQSTLTSADLGDGVHPNAGGYVKMGDTWYEAIKAYLPVGT